MLLFNLRSQLRMTGDQTVEQLARQHGIAEDTLRALLQAWLQKGRVRIEKAKLPSCARACGSCGEGSRCSGSDRIIWQGD